MTEPRVRRATVVDAAELVRLRLVMLDAMGVDVAPLGPGWTDHAVAGFEARLSETDSFAAFVVDAGESLASCAVAWLTRDLPSPWSPDGDRGNVANVCTDPGHRRQGLGRAVMLACHDWLAATGVKTAFLHATPDGEPLYRSLGWVDPHSPALVLRLNR